MTGIGSDWVLSATATPDTNVFGLKAGLEGGSFNIIVTTVATTLKSSLAAGVTQKWGLQFLAPTTFTDGGQKAGTVILTIVGS